MRREGRRHTYFFILGAIVGGGTTVFLSGNIVAGALVALPIGVISPFLIPVASAAAFAISDFAYRSLFSHAGPTQVYPKWVPFLGGKRRKPWF